MTSPSPLRLLLLTLLGLALLWASLSLAADESQAANEATDFTIHLRGSMKGSEGDLSPEAPENSDYEKQKIIAGSNGSRVEVGHWKMLVGEQLDLKSPVSFTMHVETSDAREITIWLNYVYRDSNGEWHDLGEVQGSENNDDTPLQPLNGNRTIEGSGSIDEALIPGSSNFFMNISASITWVNPFADNDAYLYWDSTERDSRADHEGRMVYFEASLSEFDNQRTDEAGQDKLFIRINITSAFGADNDRYNDLDFMTANINVEGVSEGGDIRDLAVTGSDYRAILSAHWYYQADRAEAGTYSFTFTVQDVRGAEWTDSSSFELEVDTYGVSLELTGDGEQDKQIGRSGSTQFFFKATNRGNSLDEVRFEAKCSNCGVGKWAATLESKGPFLVPAGEAASSSLSVTASDRVPSGAKLTVTITASSVNDSSAKDSLTVTIEMKTYGVQLTLPQGDNFEVDFLDLNQEEGFTFPIRVKNKGNDRDSFELSSQSTRPDWLISFMDGDNSISSVTLDASKSVTLQVRVILLNVNNGDEATLTFIARSNIDPSAIQEISAVLIAQVPLDKVVNLVVLEGSIDLSPTYLAGEDITLKVPIYNEGGKNAGPFMVQLMVDNKLKDSANVAGVAAGDTQEVVLVWKNPKQGSSQIQVIVDPQQQLKEADRQDNTFAASLEILENDNPSGDNDTPSDGLLPAPGLVLSALGLAGAALVARRTRRS